MKGKENEKFVKAGVSIIIKYYNCGVLGLVTDLHMFGCKSLFFACLKGGEHMDLQGTRFHRATEAVVQSDCAREAWQGFTADSNAIFEGCLDN